MEKLNLPSCLKSKPVTTKDQIKCMASRYKG
jgi:hypothetical protein